MTNKTCKKNIIRQLLNGQLTAEDAALQLTKSSWGIIIINYPNGLYCIGPAKGLTAAQMQERVKRASVVYHIPDNGRD